MTIKVRLIINNENWSSLPSKIQQLKDWYNVNSDGKIQLDIAFAQSSFETIPFLFFPDGSATVDESWFDTNVLDKSADTTILIIRDDQFPDFYPGGYKQLGRTTGFLGKTPTKTVVGVSEFAQSEASPQLNGFFDYVRHELMHTCYIFSGYSVGNETFGSDWTHKYWYEVKNPELSFSQLDYLRINNTLMANQTKVVKSKNSATVYMCYPVPSMQHLQERANLEGFTIPAQIPNTDTL
jgi:hypothetical protein